MYYFSENAVDVSCGHHCGYCSDLVIYVWINSERNNSILVCGILKVKFTLLPVQILDDSMDMKWQKFLLK